MDKMERERDYDFFLLLKISIEKDNNPNYLTAKIKSEEIKLFILEIMWYNYKAARKEAKL